MNKVQYALCVFGSIILVGCQSTSSIHAHKKVAHAQFVQPVFTQQKTKQKKPIIALVLGSGGARGYAHIGVIEALEQANIHPDLIVGTSAGSIVGVLYASGLTSQELTDIALNLSPTDVRDFTLNKKGFFEGKKVENFINDKVNYTPLQSLKIPMYVVATELKEGKKVVFNYGNTGQAVRASISIPSMFVPTEIAGEEYVDGGLVSPVPVEVAKDLGADIVIAVDILAQPMYTETTNIWGLFNQNINIMQKYLAETELKNADIVIQPNLMEKNHIFDTKDRENVLFEGKKAALLKLPMLQTLLKQHQDIHQVNDYKELNTD